MSDHDEAKPAQHSKTDRDAAAGSGVTRRDWFFILGQTAASIGFSGAMQAQEGRGPHASPGDTSAYPAGLYEPSNEHLAHALASDARFHPIPAGSPTDYISPRSGPYQPQFFSVPEFRMVRRIAGILLGAGEGEQSVVDEIAEWIDLSTFSSAGVREAGLRVSPAQRAVAAAFERGSRVREVEEPDPQRISREGLQWLMEEARSRYHAGFLELREENQIEILKRISDEVPGNSDNAGTRFFHWMKEETIRGFYTSRVGLKELDNKSNGFYTESPGCKRS